MTVALSRSHRTADVDVVLHELGITNTISAGSIGLKVGLICEGGAHLYLHTSPQHVAVGHLRAGHHPS
jgi:3'-phosphoadenosine 5'-phosphosulfate (PAPS) 3'-phosphatase